MKKLISFFTVALLLCFSITSNAQVGTNYTWSQATSTYTPIIGGTVVATATGLSGAASLDDIIYNLPDGTIPFTFTYDGTGYTGCNISSNGFITLGATAPSSTTYSPISTATTGYTVISAFGRDLNALFNISGFTGEIRYETIGNEFIIQYSNFRPYSTSSSTTAYWRWNFQIRLNSNGQVKVVYDANFVGAPTSSTAQVGLRGPNNTFPANVNNRLISSGTHTWATSVNGTSNSSSCAYSTTLLPVSGRQYIWSPPVVVPVDVGISASQVGNNPGQVYSVGKGYEVKATVSNYGTDTQYVVPVYYNVNGGPAVGPLNTVGPIIPGSSVNIIFSTGMLFTPVSPGFYSIKVWTALNDPNALNDTLTYGVDVYDKVSSFPYTETFDLATGWTILTVVPGGSVAPWSLALCVNPDGVANDPAALANCYAGTNSTGRVAILRSPEMNLSGLSNPVLNFYVASRTYTGEADQLRVLVSTDGGITFNPASTPYSKTVLTNPSLSTLPASTSFYSPAGQGEWRHETVDLSNVGNHGNVVIGFVSTSAYGNNHWVDNVIVSEPNSLCTDAVGPAPGSYSCNSSVTLDFTATPLPPQNGIQSDISGVSTKGEKTEEVSGTSLPTFEANAEINSGNMFDNPNGGTAFVSQFTDNDPGQSIAPNVGVTDATPPVGPAYDPVNVYHDYWFTITYDGNDQTGYATYDISIDLGNLAFIDPDNLYIVKRTDKTGAWVCQNTTISGSVLKVTGLTDFCDFAIAGQEALPVELASFVASTNGRDVTLNWATASELNNSGFDIERSVNGEWSKVGNVSGNGTSTVGHNYTYTDRNLASGSYSYRLKQIDYNGNFEYFNLNSEVNVGVPSNFDLSQNYPNPFNPSTKINYDLPVDGKVSLKIFDMSGKEVMSLVNETKTAGFYSVNFNGANLSSGIYFYSISVDGASGNFVSTKKMTLIK